MREYVCKCLNCDTYLYDENPQVGAERHNTETFEEIVPMELLNEEGESYYGCGNCQTDAYLIDV